MKNSGSLVSFVKNLGQNDVQVDFVQQNKQSMKYFTDLSERISVGFLLNNILTLSQPSVNQSARNYCFEEEMLKVAALVSEFLL